MSKQLLSESVKGLPAPKAAGVYRVRIIESDVQGSSGYYTRELLETYGPAAFPASTLSHTDHPTLEQREQRPEGSVLTLGGYTIGTPVVESDGLYVDMKFAGKALEIVENFGEVIGLSIRAQGDVEEAERDGVTIREVKAIYPSPLNSIDLVTVPGAGGKIVEALQESLKESETPTSADQERKATPMEIAELAGKVDALTEALNSFIANASPILEALKPEEAPEVDVVEAVIAANKAASDLPEALRDQVIEAVKLDPTLDTTALIAKHAELVESIRTNVTEAAGFIVGGSQAPKSAVEIGKVLL
jgi:hypothetical protein